MINRHYILDLMPDKSLVRHLMAAGYPVAMVDWGAPGDEDRDLPFERYADDYLRRAIRAARLECEAESAILLGYCLGGTMAAMHAALRPETIAGLIVLTAPFDFHNSGLLSAWCRTSHSDVGALVGAYGNVPWSLMQNTFQCLRPTSVLSRFLGFHKRIWNDEFLDSFAALETWGNDNVSFPGRCYAEFIRELYQKNGLMKKTLQLSGEIVDLKRIRAPVLNVAASADHIVPREATAPFRDLVSSRDFTDVVAPGGHIGAIVSRKASAGLWTGIEKWLDERFSPNRASQSVS
jgi:polyhydroxyalkanoate synthase